MVSGADAHGVGSVWAVERAWGLQTCGSRTPLSPPWMMVGETAGDRSRRRSVHKARITGPQSTPYEVLCQVMLVNFVVAIKIRISRDF